MSRYGKYFLVSEADEDITIPTTSRATDFTSFDDTAGGETTGDAVDVTVSPNNRGTDFTSFDEPEPDTTETDTNPPEENGDNPEDPELVDDTDFTDGVENDDTTSTGPEEDNPDDTPTEDDNKPETSAPGIEYSSTRTYMLYREFEDLLDTVNILIVSMEKYSTNSLEKGAIAGKVLNKLREIQELLRDYMLMRFKLSSYVQNTIFYNKIVISIKATIELLSTIKKVDEEENK